MSGKRILLVEDNVVNRRLAQFLLKSHGYEVWEAGSAPEAFATLVERRPDLILMDIQLPGMDGLAATRALKADPATHAIPVVAVTSYAMPGDEAMALEAGCSGYLTKPIEKTRLLEIVAGVLQNAQAGYPQGGGVALPGAPSGAPGETREYLTPFAASRGWPRRARTSCT